MTWPLRYDPVGRRPSGRVEPGTRALQQAILERFSPPATNLGIYNPRDVRGNVWPNVTTTLSIHAEGRAGDVGFPTRGHPDGHPRGHELARLLVERAVPLGVQEVIWARRRWAADDGRWDRYSGRSAHLDHVHWSQHRAAARSLTLTAARSALDRTAPPVVPIEETDVPAPTDFVRRIPAGHLGIDDKAHYLLRADGTVEVHGGKDFGHYQRLKPEHRTGERYFLDMWVAGDGYELLANDKSIYRFDAATKPLLKS